MDRQYENPSQSAKNNINKGTLHIKKQNNLNHKINSTNTLTLSNGNSGIDWGAGGIVDIEF